MTRPPTTVPVEAKAHDCSNWWQVFISTLPLPHPPVCIPNTVQICIIPGDGIFVNCNYCGDRRHFRLLLFSASRFRTRHNRARTCFCSAVAKCDLCLPNHPDNGFYKDLSISSEQVRDLVHKIFIRIKRNLVKEI